MCNFVTHGFVIFRAHVIKISVSAHLSVFGVGVKSFKNVPGLLPCVEKGITFLFLKSIFPKKEYKGVAIVYHHTGPPTNTTS